MAAATVSAGEATRAYQLGGMLIKVWEDITTEAGDTIVVTHGGPSVPDVYWTQLTSADPTASDISVTAVSSTTLTLDCEDDGNDTFNLYAFWFNADSTDAPTL